MSKTMLKNFFEYMSKTMLKLFLNRFYQTMFFKLSVNVSRELYDCLRRLRTLRTKIYELKEYVFFFGRRRLKQVVKTPTFDFTLLPARKSKFWEGVLTSANFIFKKRLFYKLLGNISTICQAGPALNYLQPNFLTCTCGRFRWSSQTIIRTYIHRERNFHLLDNFEEFFPRSQLLSVTYPRHRSIIVQIASYTSHCC